VLKRTPFRQDLIVSFLMLAAQVDVRFPPKADIQGRGLIVHPAASLSTTGCSRSVWLFDRSDQSWALPHFNEDGVLHRANQRHCIAVVSRLNPIVGPERSSLGVTIDAVILHSHSPTQSSSLDPQGARDSLIEWRMAVRASLTQVSMFSFFL